MNKLIIYGDIHGCYDEFTSLRKKINPQKDDIEVCVGDIITRGKDSIRTLRYIQEHNIKSVLGNHEDKIIRYLQYQNTANKNLIILDEDEQNIVNHLDSKDIDFLMGLPLFMKFEDITILHGGLKNSYNLDNLTKNEKSKILRMRYLDNNQSFIAFGKEENDSIFWADLYDGNQGFVVYGHQWDKEVKINQFAIGIDTGCTYGNKLSAVIFQNFTSKNFFIENMECMPNK
jgi:bis(5'-nucleosyl)-tetraphosphatase (symmetrical)